MGVRLALLLAQAGNEVLLGSRSKTRAREIAQFLAQENIIPVDYNTAVTAKMVLPAIFVRDGLFDILQPFKTHLADKILIDITNPFNADYTDFILPWDTSSAEQLQSRFPESQVVGAFKNVWWEVFDAPRFHCEDTDANNCGLLSDVYVVSDNEHAKQEFFLAVKSTPFRYVDAGRLANARTIERMTLLSGELGQRLGFFPRMNYRLLGENWTVGKADSGISKLIARN